VNLGYFQKDEKELVSIKQCEIIKTVFSNAVNPQVFQKFAYIVGILNDFSPPSDPNERLHRMAKVCFETSNENLENLDQIILYFELWLLKLGGYLPAWDKCNICKREFELNEKANLQTNFHLVCHKCQNTKNGWIINSIQRTIFLIAQKNSPLKFLEKTNDKASDIKEVSIVLKRIISSVLGKENVGEKVVITSV
jgi:DNA repair protein RecO (recombination protein O)